MKRFPWPLVAAIGLMALTSGAVRAADAYPSRPVKVIVNTAPGGLVDITTRLIAQRMSAALKQPLVVENRAGGDALIAIRFVKSAPADGYTLLATAGTLVFANLIKEDPGYDIKDFTGIGMMGESPFLFVESPDQPDKTLADFIARARANPNQLSYASGGFGAAPHLAAALFMNQEGLKLLHVPYKGNGAAMPDVLSGRVTAIMEAFGSSAGQIKSAKLKVLGVTGKTRMAALPDVPTFMEQGVKDFTYYTWICLVAPAGTSAEVVQRLSQTLRAVTSSKEVRDRFREDGMEVVDMSPQQLNEHMAAEAVRATKLIRSLGLARQ